MLKKPFIRKKALLRFGSGFALFALFATAVNVVLFPYARNYYRYDVAFQLPLFALAAAFFLLIGHLLSRAQHHTLERAERIVRPAVTLFFLTVHLLLGYWMEYIPQGDNRLIYDGAKMLITTGHFTEPLFPSYYAHFHNQWGALLLTTSFFKLLYALHIENTFYALVIVQSLLYAAAIPLLFSIVRKLCGLRAELMTALMLILCFPFYLASSILYTDTFSLPFLIFTLYFAIRVSEQKSLRGTLIHSFFCGLSAAIGCQIKMTVAIILIAAAILWLLTMRPSRMIPSVLIIVALVFGASSLTQRAMTAKVLDPQVAARNKTPLIHWVMMSIPTGNNPHGGYCDDYTPTWNLIDAGASHEEVMDSIYTRIKDRIYTLRYPNRLFTAVMRKNAAAMGDGTFGMTEMLDDLPVRENAISSIVLQKRPHYTKYQTICSAIWGAHLLFAALGVWLDLRSKDTRRALLHIVVFGMLLFMLLWEAKSRYIFNFTPLVLMLSASFCCRPNELFLRKKP